MITPRFRSPISWLFQTPGRGTGNHATLLLEEHFVFFVFFLLCFASFVFLHFLLDFMIAPGQATASRPQSLIGEALCIFWFFFFSFYIFCIFAFFLHFMITRGRATSSQATLSNWRGQSLDTHVATLLSSSFCQTNALTYHTSRCNFVSPHPSPHFANQKLWPTYHFAKQNLWPPTYQDVILSPFLLPSAADPAFWLLFCPPLLQALVEICIT